MATPQRLLAFYEETNKFPRPTKPIPLLLKFPLLSQFVWSYFLSFSFPPLVKDQGNNVTLFNCNAYSNHSARGARGLSSTPHHFETWGFYYLFGLTALEINFVNYSRMINSV